jgi:hypothetical protein
MHRRNLTLILLVAALFALSSVTYAEAPNWSQPVFGIIEGGARPAEAQQLGAQWERLSFHWNLFQPSGPNDFNPEAISPVALESARSAGRQVVGLIQGTPNWASASGSTASVPTGLDLPYNDPNNTFASFVTRLVSHYSAQGIHHWVIWNEPDIRPGEGHVEFEGEVEDYYRLLKSGYLAARAADPGAHIQMAGLTWWYDTEHGRQPYLQRLLPVIAADPEAAQNNWYFDGISIHAYFMTSSIWYLANSYRHVLGEFGLAGKQIWLSEYNASPRRDPAASIGAPFQLSLEQQADFIVQASALALVGGIDRLAVYKLYDNDFVPGRSEPWGLVRADGSLRPAFTTYQQVIANFRNANDVRRYSSEEATLVTLEFGDRTLHVMWNDTFTAGEFLIAAQGITVTDALGNQWNPRDGQPTVIDAPAAEQVDMPGVVVAGPVRMVTLPGGPHSVSFRSASGGVTPLY